MNECELENLKWFKKEECPLYISEVDLPGKSKGWLVIDSISNGQAVGGVRLGQNVTLEEVRDLAAEMTLKFSFLNLPIGGAKAGIYCPNHLNKKEREEIFYKFGSELVSLLKENKYLPGTDMGTFPEDIDELFKGAGISRKSDRQKLDSGFYTALSVFSAMQAVTSFTEVVPHCSIKL